jgi:hypothetical protein
VDKPIISIKNRGLAYFANKTAQKETLTTELARSHQARLWHRASTEVFGYYQGFSSLQAKSHPDDAATQNFPAFKSSLGIAKNGTKNYHVSFTNLL